MKRSDCALINRLNDGNNTSSLAVLQKALQDQFPLYKVGLFDVLAFAKQNAKDLPAEINAEVKEFVDDLGSAIYKQYVNNLEALKQEGLADKVTIIKEVK